MFLVSPDPTGNKNGDLAIRTDAGTLYALVYSRDHGKSGRTTQEVAEVIAAALNAAFSPGHTDMMVTPEQLDAWLKDNPPPTEERP